MQIGVTNFNGSSLLVSSTPGKDHKPEKIVPTVEINEAKSGEPFHWENWSACIFPGFYDSLISGTAYVDDIVENDRYYVQDLENEGQEVPDYYFKDYDDFEEKVINNHPLFWRAYENIVSKEYTSLIWSAIKEADLDDAITSMEFDHIWSPSYYNFQTDKLNLRLTCNWEDLEDEIQFDLPNFKKYLNETWSSRDGFVSFVPNTYEELKNSKWYREVCIEYLILSAIKLNENRYDEFSSIEGCMYYWLREDLSYLTVVEEADRLAKEEQNENA